MGAHRSPGLDAVMVEVTTLGTGIVVIMIVAVSSSFPSGHAMSAAVVYSTVAYLAARLHKRRWARWLVMTAALIVIALISMSRLYLGVNYPSDVVGGVAIGLAWAGF